MSVKHAFYCFLIVVIFSVVGVKTGLTAPKKPTTRKGYSVGYPAETGKSESTTAVPYARQRVAQPQVVAQSVSSHARSLVVEREVAITSEAQTVSALEQQVFFRDRKISVLEERLARVTAKLEQKEAELFMVKPQVSRQYEVRKGDSLWKIAAKRKIYGDPYMWIKIYNANMAKIKKPNVIYSGQLFDIPK